MERIVSAAPFAPTRARRQIAPTWNPEGLVGDRGYCHDVGRRIGRGLIRTQLNSYDSDTVDE